VAGARMPTVRALQGDMPMIQFHHILCPVDTSEFSRRALQHAVALGRWYDAPVTVLSVRSPNLPPALWAGHHVAFPPETLEMREQAVEGLRHFVRNTVGELGGSVVLVDGGVVAEILRAARELAADLIVMGTHGLSGFERLLLGSVTEKILRKAPCPVLTIPRLAAGATEPPEVRFSRIVCGVDRAPASRRGLDYALSLAQEAGGSIVLLHAVENLLDEEPRFARHFDTPECREEISADLTREYASLVPAEARVWSELEVRIVYGKAYTELLSIARERRADLIVVGTSGTAAIFGSTAQHVLREAACPVLVVPAEEPRRA
jgi:nucleotide-binding universal stress UspA family protein